MNRNKKYFQFVNCQYLGEDGEVQPEEAEVECCGDESEDGDPRGAVGEQLPVGQRLVGQQAPVVLHQQVPAQEAGVDPDILHTATNKILKKTLFNY